MSLFDAATIARFAQRAEDEISAELRPFISRYAIPIISGTAEYVISDTILDVRRVTYKGVKLYPINHRTYRDYGIPTSSGKPTNYIYNNIGQNTIKLYPIPNETLNVTQSNLFGLEIANQCIVEYYSAPNYVDVTIPVFFRRRIIKAYTLKMCFALEGKGQNLKASKYWDDKYTALKEIYGNLLFDLINKPRRLIASGDIVYRQIGRPMLPISRFGIGVRTGE